ncbi:MAG: hypothetical protein ACI9OJ_002813 [Myxococcota bacterium]|jgi:hypothetical protein
MSLSIVGLAVIGSVFWVISTEAMAILYGSQGWNPFYVGALCALGQNIAYVGIYFGGEQLLDRWKLLAKQVRKLRDKLGDGVRRGFLITTGFSHVVGFPPAPATVALAPGFSVRPMTLFPLTFTARWVRFTVLAFAGEPLVAWWNTL